MRQAVLVLPLLSCPTSSQGSGRRLHLRLLDRLRLRPQYPEWQHLPQLAAWHMPPRATTHLLQLRLLCVLALVTLPVTSRIARPR